MLYDFLDKKVVNIMCPFRSIFRLKEVSESKEKSGFLRYDFMTRKFKLTLAEQVKEMKMFILKLTCLLNILCKRNI